MIKHYILQIGKTIMCIAFGIAVGYLVSRWAIPAAYAERGYEALGGEWIVIFGSGWIGTAVMYKLWRCDG